jgi:hypothetical protein
MLPQASWHGDKHCSSAHTAARLRSTSLQVLLNISTESHTLAAHNCTWPSEEIHQKVQLVCRLHTLQLHNRSACATSPPTLSAQVLLTHGGQTKNQQSHVSGQNLVPAGANQQAYRGCCNSHKRCSAQKCCKEATRSAQCIACCHVMQVPDVAMPWDFNPTPTQRKQGDAVCPTKPRRSGCTLGNSTQPNVSSTPNIHALNGSNQTH